MKKTIGLSTLIFIIFGCCPFTGAAQKIIDQIQNTISGIDVTEYIDIPENLEGAETNIVETEVEYAFIININPCESIYEKYEHYAALGEIKEDYIGSWHASEFVSDGFNERFVLFSSGNYLFFPSQYECAYGSGEACVPSPIEDGLWGVQDHIMNFAKEGDINNVISKSITDVIASPEDESPYPFKTIFDGITFWLMSKDTNLWDPESGEYCD